MRQVFAVVVAIVLSFGSAAAQSLEDRGSPREAQDMVERAIALYEELGLRAFYVISREPAPDYLDRDLHVFVIDRVGYMAAHALFPDSVGQSAIQSRDLRGKYYVREMLERASDTGVWVDYVFLDPLDGEPAPKSAWVVYHDGFLFACGIYTGELGV